MLARSLTEPAVKLAATFVAILALAATATPASAHTLVDSVPGGILDANATSTLYKDSAGVLHIKDRATSNVDTIVGATGFPAYLSPHGAIFSSTVSSPQLYEWRDGQLVALGPITNSSLRVKGNYAVWANGSTLYRRDLASGTTITVASGTPFSAYLDRDVAANGAVTYAAADGIHLYKDGIDQLIVPDNPVDSVFYTAPRTDGTNVVYRDAGDTSGAISVWWAGQGNVRLPSARNDTYPPTPVPDQGVSGQGAFVGDYEIGGGWVVWDRPVGPSGCPADLPNCYEVRRRNAAGVEEVIPWPGPGVRGAGPGSGLYGMNDLGELVEGPSSCESCAARNLHLTPVGGPPSQTLTSSSSGYPFAIAVRYFYWGGDWYFSANSDLLRVERDQPADVTTTVTESKDPVLTGQPEILTFVVANGGPATANRVGLRIFLPDKYLRYESIDTTAGNCPPMAQAGNTKATTCTLGTIAPGAQVTVTVHARAVLAGQAAVNTTYSTYQFEYDPDSTDSSGTVNTTVIDASFARPKGATPVHVSLTPAYQPCVSGNRTHAAPLSFPSCSPPSQTSQYLTVGTPDANGQAAKSIGHLKLLAYPGDVALELGLSDVRRKSDLSDYAGEVQAKTSVRITDKNSAGSGGTSTPDGTLQDFTYDFAALCTPNPTADGSDCAVSTTANALVAGTITTGKRAIWELGQVQVDDGGSDGVASTTADNTLFEVQGVFVP